MGDYAFPQSTMLETALRTLLANDDLSEKPAEWLMQWQLTDCGYIPAFIWRRALENVDKFTALRPLYQRGNPPARGNGRRALETDGFALLILRRKLERLPVGEKVAFGQFKVRRIICEAGVRWRVYSNYEPRCDHQYTELEVMAKLLEVRA